MILTLSNALSYDREADMLSLVLDESPVGPVRTTEPRPGVEVDVDGKGRLVAVWISGASLGVPSDVLATLPKPPEDMLTLEEAGKESGVSPSTLRVQINAGKIAGEKRGRDWYIARHELWSYLESRAPAGRRAKK